MAEEGALAEARRDLPKLDCFIAGAADQAFVVHHEGNPGYGVVVAVERLSALVLVELPQFDGQVAGAGHQVLARVVEVDA